MRKTRRSSRRIQRLQSWPDELRRLFGQHQIKRVQQAVNMLGA